MAEEKRREGRSFGRPWETINPFDTMRDLMNRMVDTVIEPLSRLSSPPFRAPAQRFQPSVDVIEEDEDVRIEVEAPGMTVDDLSVGITEDTVIVSGEKKPEEAEAGDVHRRERAYGSFRRTIRLPVEVDKENARASFKDGILTIRLPKSQAVVKKVEIKAG